MVRQLTEWKINFYKNNTDTGGAQAEAIKDCPTDEIIIHSQTQKNGRMWGHVKPEKLLTLVDANRGLYEIITKYPHKVYFDIEKDERDTELLEKVKSIIVKYFPNADMAISGSIYDTKTSYHITLQNYHIHDVKERELVKCLVKYVKENEDDSFDAKVYTNNRQMKCINQSKDDGRVQAIIENPDYKAHMITCFLSNYANPFQSFPEEVHEEVLLEDSKKPFNLGSLPKLKLETPENFDIETATAMDILKITPLVPKSDFTYIHFVARFCYYNDISFDAYLSWLRRRNPNIVKNENGIQKWNNLSKFPEVSKLRMVSLLRKFYPDMQNDIHYRKFEETFNLPQERIQKIETIDQQCFMSPQKYSILNVGMGGGKTAQSIEYLQDCPSFIWITPNIALAQNTMKRFEDKNIEVSIYQEVKTKDKEKGKLKDFNNLIVCLNSLHYLNDNEAHEVKRRSYPVLIIDEIETLLNKFEGDFMGLHKIPIWTTFVNMFRRADKVVLLDAFITRKTIDFIRAVENPSFDGYVIYERILEPQTRTVKYMSKVNAMLADIIDKLKNGEKVFVFYPYKDGSSSAKSFTAAMSAVYETLIEKSGIDRSLTQFYHANVDSKIKNTLRDVNTAWGDKKLIIVNNLITCGVNYEKEDIDYTYIMVAGHNSPRDIIQVSYRARFLSSKTIKVCYIGRMMPKAAWINDCDIVACPIYRSLYNSIMVEEKAPLRQCFNLFCVKAHYAQVEDTFELPKEVDDDITKLLEDHNLLVSYESIKDIERHEAEYIQSRVFAQQATMDEKYELSKYFFKKSFKENADPEMLSEIWDNKYVGFFKRLKEVLKDENHLFIKIASENNLSSLFPENIKTMKYSDEVVDLIKSNITFRDFDAKKMTAKKTKDIYNLYFNKQVITSTYDKNKNMDYTIDSECAKYFEFAKSNLILDQIIGLTFEETTNSVEVLLLKL